ncbi:MAG TPA: hypothetical protein VK171_01155 [Fimbriimonas sp.]|nr:hypothetical protein [Fimbriimonas sp.]
MDLFILLTYDNHIWAELSEDQQAHWTNEFRNFARSIDEKIVQADPVNTLARMITSEGDEVIDASEDPDRISGYFIFQAEGWDAAVEIANTCPTIALGGHIELRRVGR